MNSLCLMFISNHVWWIEKQRKRRQVEGINKQVLEFILQSFFFFFFFFVFFFRYLSLLLPQFKCIKSCISYWNCTSPHTKSKSMRNLWEIEILLKHLIAQVQQAMHDSMHWTAWILLCDVHLQQLMCGVWKAAKKKGAEGKNEKMLFFFFFNFYNFFFFFFFVLKVFLCRNFIFSSLRKPFHNFNYYFYCP